MSDTDAGLTEIVCSAIAWACKCERARVSPDTTLLDLDMDSFTLVAVLTQIELTYEMELEPETILELLEADSVADLVQRLARAVRAT